MKKSKIISLFLTAIMIVTGMCGCMFTNSSEKQAKLTQMKSYAENKYNISFDVVRFDYARDQTYSNILKLTDGNVDFYVYNSGKPEYENNISDDYKRAIISNKTANLIEDKVNASAYSAEVYASVFIYGDAYMDYEKISHKSVNKILESEEIFSTTIVVKTNKNLTEIKNLLFEIYNMICQYKPEAFNLYAIQATGKNTKLDSTLSCLIGYYNDDWSSYSGVKSYLEINEFGINSADEIVSRINYL